MFNCKKGFELGCKGDCCGIVPINKTIVKLNEHKQQREVVEIIEFSPTEIIPMTKDLKCVFLNNNYECEIYDNRPGVCRKFGISKINELLMCPYLKPSGNVRSKASKIKLMRICNKKSNNIFTNSHK